MFLMKVVRIKKCVYRYSISDCLKFEHMCYLPRVESWATKPATLAGLLGEEGN